MQKPGEIPKRAVNEPPTSSVVRGPREGFIEDIATNVQLVKKRLTTSDFVTKELVAGKYTKTKIVVAYLKGVADEKIVDGVIKRIKGINIDGIIDSHYVMQFLQGENLNIFRQVGTDEKPDIITAKMLEGRVAIIVDGSPFVLTVPYILFEDIQNSDDYYTNSTSVSLRRFVRICGAVIAIVLPGLYIAMQLYHYNIVPLNTLIVITNSVGSSPFSPMIEMIFVLILFEVLYEAALRMPKHLGTATSLVGALVLGDTAVKAGLISSPVVLVAALSGITMYILPNLAPQISLLRFFFALVGGILGLYGIVIAVILLVIYLASLESYGAPLLAPYAPLVKSDLKDGIIKQEVKQMTKRPRSFSNPNKTRQKP